MVRLQANFVLLLALVLSAAHINAATLSDIKFAELPGERAELRLAFDSPPVAPTGYAIEQPARIVLDFAGISSQLSQKKYTMNVGKVTSAVVVEGGGRTRLVVNLDESVPYRSYQDGNDFVVEVGVSANSASPSYVAGSDQSSSTESAQPSNPASSSSAPSQNYPSESIGDIDFRRGEVGEGKIILDLNETNLNIGIEQVSSGLEIKLLDATLPKALARKLDVVDFATPVSMISAKQESDGVRIAVETNGEYDYLAYQADNQYVINVKPLTREELEEKKKEFAYVGDRLSLNFQNIPVRNVLQLIADFTSLNLVASDTVSGSITLRLDNVPWDQALDIVLKTKGLDKRKIGNVLMVAPAAEIAERERQEIETQKQLQELAPMRTEYIRVRYANARELFSLFLDGGSGEGGGGGEGGAGQQNSTGTLLSERGRAIVDERTNSIMLTDTEEKIQEFKRLIDKVDIPVRQVMIEARIVIANTDFRKELGVRIAGDAVETSPNGRRKFEFTGRMEGLVNGDGDGPEAVFVDTDQDGVTDDERDLLSSNLVDLGVFNPAGAFTWNVISSNFLLGMELSALQNSGFAEIVSQPKVITGDKQQASIESGTEIGYQEESASGGTTTSFKEAVLKLDVTPQITPDNRVIMDLEITQDSVSGFTTTGVPILDITQLETQVLVSDAETIVLGGIYQTETTKSQQKVPLLGDIPFLGRLFRNDLKREDKREILIFITPRVMASSFTE
ncbi:MAG: type IV pilus secretin PilQ [Agarilytica sp.]